MSTGITTTLLMIFFMMNSHGINLENNKFRQSVLSNPNNVSKSNLRKDMTEIHEEQTIIRVFGKSNGGDQNESLEALKNILIERVCLLRDPEHSQIILVRFYTINHSMDL